MLNDWKRGLESALGSLSEGWRELRDRASGALVRFRPGSTEASPDGYSVSGWGFMAADLSDDDRNVVVRLEAPGMHKDDFAIEVRDDVLVVRGEKHFERESSDSRYHLVQCSYGSFRREIGLPVEVKANLATATYRDGVLRITLPKRAAGRSSSIPVQVD
jgi:HSP20 family protein